MAQRDRGARLWLEGGGLTGRAAKKELKAKKAVLKQRMAQQRSLLRARSKERRSKDHPSARRRRRRRLLLLVSLLLLYLLLRNCECDQPPPMLVEPPAPAPPVTVVPEEIVPKPPAKRARKRRRKRPRGHEKITPTPRPAYDSLAAAPQQWLAAFRLQVAARSPRLSRCFEGADQPGALKWTASFDPERGVVADHELEPILAGALLSKKLSACLIQVLSTPPYRIPEEHRPASSTRVSIVIEF